MRRVASIRVVDIAEQRALRPMMPDDLRGGAERCGERAVEAAHPERPIRIEDQDVVQGRKASRHAHGLVVDVGMMESSTSKVSCCGRSRHRRCRR